jgi:hypothetical protein
MVAIVQKFYQHFHKWRFPCATHTQVSDGKNRNFKIGRTDKIGFIQPVSQPNNETINDSERK